MRRLISMILLSLLLIGCTSNQTTSISTPIADEKGFGDIEKIKVTKFIYKGERLLQNQKIDKVIIIEKTQNIKNFMDIFNSKEISMGQFDVLPFEYEIKIIKKDGSVEKYDMAFSNKDVFFHDNGTGWFIHDGDRAKELQNVIL